MLNQVIGKKVNCFLDLSENVPLAILLLASDASKSFQLDYPLACYY